MTNNERLLLTTLAAAVAEMLEGKTVDRDSNHNMARAIRDLLHKVRTGERQ